MWIAFSGFSGNVFAILIYYLEVGNVGMWVVVRLLCTKTALVTRLPIFFPSIFYTSAGFKSHFSASQELKEFSMNGTKILLIYLANLMQRNDTLYIWSFGCDC